MKKSLTILHSNDMHGDFLAEKIDSKLVGGVSLLSGYVKKARAQSDSVLYAISGDMFKGSIIDSEYKGISTIEIMNLLSPDVVTLGNHEIDYGIAHLLFIEKCAKFPIINANLFIKTNHTRLFEPYKTVEVNGLKIMFIGIITEEILAQTKNEDLIGAFVDVREAAQEVGVICDTYKTTDVALTALLTHIGFEKDKELAALIDNSWGVDLIIGGHSHTLLDEPCVVNGIPIVQAYTGTDQIGRLEYVFEGGKKPALESWQLVSIDESHCPKDELLEDMILNYKSKTDQKYARIITTLDRELTHPARNRETELGNLFADVMQTDSSFDIMLLGSGSIRCEKLGPIVQLQNLKEAFPYDDPLYLVEVTGAQLRRMIAYVLREEAFEGDHTEFYQYSKGVRFRWSRSQQKFLEFKYNGKDIADTDIFKLGLQKYHYSNFEKFFNVPFEEVCANRKPRLIASSCFGIYEELFSTQNHLDARVEGRLEVVQ